MAFVEFNDVRKVYKMGEVEVAAADGMTFSAKKRIDILLNSLSENELRLVEGIINAIIENRGTEGA